MAKNLLLILNLFNPIPILSIFLRGFLNFPKDALLFYMYGSFPQWMAVSAQCMA